MSYRAAVAFGVALIVFLAGGIYLGGHPSKLPTWAREAFTEEPTSLVGEASEIIKDNYFRKVGNTELGNSSLQGMVRELRRRHALALVDHMLRIQGRATTGVGILRSLSAMAEDAITDEVPDLNPFKGVGSEQTIQGPRRSADRFASSASIRCTPSPKQPAATRRWSASSPTPA